MAEARRACKSAALIGKRKFFFFEKKKQKTFTPGARHPVQPANTHSARNR
jgi:hypothetical protein